MDSQHRHELQQNDLRKLTDRTLPFFKKYGTPMLVVLGVLTLAFIIGAWWYTSGAASSADGWTQLDGAVNKQNSSADDFARVTEKYPGSTAAHWASLLEAEDYLKSGMNYLFTDREAALTDLKKAQAAFERLAGGGTGIVDNIRERALFGLARCLESTVDGNTSVASDAYRRLLREFPTSMFLNIANDRIAALEKPEAKEFYAWFQQQNPKPKNPLDLPFRKPGEATERPDESSDSKEPSEELQDAAPASTEPASESPPADAEPAKEQPAAQPDSSQPSETPGDANSQ